MQTGKQTGRQLNRQVNMQAGRQMDIQLRGNVETGDCRPGKKKVTGGGDEALLEKNGKRFFFSFDQTLYQQGNSLMSKEVISFKK